MCKPDLTMCCGTTCDKAANERYVKHLEFSLAVLAAARIGHNPVDVLNPPEDVDFAYADEVTEAVYRNHAKE